VGGRAEVDREAKVDQVDTVDDWINTIDSQFKPYYCSFETLANFVDSAQSAL